MTYFELLIFFAIVLISEMGYLRLADHFNIIDKPNERSSHTVVTIRGGGVIFPLAFLLAFFYYGCTEYYRLAGLLLIALVSMIDDVIVVKTRWRMFIQMAAVGISFIDLHVWSGNILLLLPFILILIVGVINAYNFMDGINGITGLYSLSLFVSLYLINSTEMEFTDPHILAVMMLACLVFLFFNYRKKALCFAGDVGSVSIAMILVYSTFKLIVHSGQFSYLFFFAVYGVDSVLTILHRLKLREDIFQPHRLHFYQMWVNEFGARHRYVAAVYALVQLAINLGIVYLHNNPIQQALWIGIWIMLLGGTYLLIKPRMMQAKWARLSAK